MQPKKVKKEKAAISHQKITEDNTHNFKYASTNMLFTSHQNCDDNTQINFVTKSMKKEEIKYEPKNIDIDESNNSNNNENTSSNKEEKRFNSSQESQGNTNNSSNEKKKEEIKEKKFTKFNISKNYINKKRDNFQKNDIDFFHKKKKPKKEIKEKHKEYKKNDKRYNFDQGITTTSIFNSIENDKNNYDITKNTMKQTENKFEVFNLEDNKNNINNVIHLNDNNENKHIINKINNIINNNNQNNNNVIISSIQKEEYKTFNKVYKNYNQVTNKSYNNTDKNNYVKSKSCEKYSGNKFNVCKLFKTITLDEDKDNLPNVRAISPVYNNPLKKFDKLVWTEAEKYEVLQSIKTFSIFEIESQANEINYINNNLVIKNIRNIRENVDNKEDMDNIENIVSKIKEEKEKENSKFKELLIDEEKPSEIKIEEDSLRKIEEIKIEEEIPKKIEEIKLSEDTPKKMKNDDDKSIRTHKINLDGGSKRRKKNNDIDIKRSKKFLRNKEIDIIEEEIEVSKDEKKKKKYLDKNPIINITEEKFIINDKEKDYDKIKRKSNSIMSIREDISKLNTGKLNINNGVINIGDINEDNDVEMIKFKNSENQNPKKDKLFVLNNEKGNNFSNSEFTINNENNSNKDNINNINIKNFVEKDKINCVSNDINLMNNINNNINNESNSINIFKNMNNENISYNIGNNLSSIPNYNVSSEENINMFKNNNNAFVSNENSLFHNSNITGNNDNILNNFDKIFKTDFNNNSSNEKSKENQNNMPNYNNYIINNNNKDNIQNNIIIKEEEVKNNNKNIILNIDYNKQNKEELNNNISSSSIIENDKNDKKIVINVDKVVKQNIEVKLEPNTNKKINNEIIASDKKEEQKIIEDIDIKDCSREESNIISLNNVSESSHHRISLGKPSKSKSQSKSEKSIVSNTENKEKQDDDEEEEEVIPPPKPNDFLPCREKEQEIIYKYIKTGLYTKGNYSSLYISGMPGTGKTDSVNRVIEILEKQYENCSKKKKKFQTIYINGIDYLLPKKVFKSIYDKIFSKKKKILAIIKSLDEFFKNRNYFNSSPYLKDPTNSHIILVLDEVDLLIDKSQTLLYNIFNWTTYPQSKLIVLSISNTLDLPNRLLTKVQSRMGNNKIMFKPYTKDELHKIILSRGIDINTYSEDALKLSSMKVAAVNGDLRRIIQILNKSKEIYEQEKKDFPNASNQDLITKYHILKACEELFDSKITKVLRMLQVSEKIILAALLTKIKDNNESKINVGEIFEKKDKFLEKYNENCSLELSISWNEFQRIIYNLLRLKIISFIDGQRDNFIDNYVIIKFYSDEFMAACDGNESMKPVIDLINNLMGNYNSN